MFSNFLTHKDELSSPSCHSAAVFGKLFMHAVTVQAIQYVPTLKLIRISLAWQKVTRYLCTM